MVQTHGSKIIEAFRGLAFERACENVPSAVRAGTALVEPLANSAVPATVIHQSDAADQCSTTPLVGSQVR